MEQPRQNGFVLILVITAIAAIAAGTFALAGLSNTMLFESNTACLQAIERNLAASGLAWAKHNIEDQNKETFNKTIELDLTNMHIPNADLSVSIASPKDQELEVQISSSCSRGRRTFRHSDKYHIRL